MPRLRTGRASARVGVGRWVVRVAAASSADPRNVEPALLIGVKTAIGAAPDVIGAPGSIRARRDAGECGQCDQRGGDEDDASHGNLLGRRAVHPAHHNHNGLSPGGIFARGWSKAFAGTAWSSTGLLDKKSSRAETLLPKTQLYWSLRYAYASNLSVMIETAAAFAPTCPPKTWTAGHLGGGLPRALTSRIGRYPISRALSPESETPVGQYFDTSA